MATETKLVTRVRSFSRGHWIYLPKAIYLLLGEPDAFKIEVEGERLILLPIKEVSR